MRGTLTARGDPGGHGSGPTPLYQLRALHSMINHVLASFVDAVVDQLRRSQAEAGEEAAEPVDDVADLQQRLRFLRALCIYHSDSEDRDFLPLAARL